MTLRRLIGSSARLDPPFASTRIRPIKERDADMDHDHDCQAHANELASLDDGVGKTRDLPGRQAANQEPEYVHRGAIRRAADPTISGGASG
jgi:hypothetical protein